MTSQMENFLQFCGFSLKRRQLIYGRRRQWPILFDAGAYQLRGTWSDPP